MDVEVKKPCDTVSFEFLKNKTLTENINRFLQERFGDQNPKGNFDTEVNNMLFYISQSLIEHNKQTPNNLYSLLGETDPFPDLINEERHALALGKYTDDQIANMVFMYYDIKPPINDVVSGRARMPITYVTAAKERIRWLSRHLDAAQHRVKELEEELAAAKQKAIPEDHVVVPGAWLQMVKNALQRDAEEGKTIRQEMLDMLSDT